MTVIVPVKTLDNPFLPDALQSIFDQTSPRWRLSIVVEPDDIDQARAALAEPLADDRVSLFANQRRGLAGGINTAVAAAHTPFVALLCDDDLWARDAVETLEWYIDALPSVDFFHSGRRIVDHTGRPISSEHPARREVTLEDFESMAPVKHLLCWRRETGMAAGGLYERAASVGPDDLDFPWTMAEHGALFCAVDACLYIYRDHRATDRLTTHIPLSVHIRTLRRMYRRHGVGRAASRARVDEARRTFLQQCLYRNRAERWYRETFRRPPRRIWQDTYR